MSACETIHPLLPLHADGALSPREGIRVTAHLEECAEARSILSDYQALRRFLLEAPEPVPPADLHGRILDRVYERETPSAKILPLRPWWLNPRWWSVAAAAMAVGFFLNLAPEWGKLVDQAKAPAPSGSFAPEATGGAAPGSGTSPAEEQAAKKESLASAPVAPPPDTSREAPLPLKPLFLARVPVPARRPMPGIQNVSYGANAAASEDRAAAPAPASSSVAFKRTRNLPRPSAAAASAALKEDIAPPGGTVRWGGNQGPYGEEHAEVITDPMSFMAYWQLMMPGEPAPGVDFSRQAVVVIFLGTRPTAGYTVSVDGVAEGADAVTVQWHEEAPAPDAVAAQVITRPWALQEIPLTSKPVVFQKKQ